MKRYFKGERLKADDVTSMVDNIRRALPMAGMGTQSPHGWSVEKRRPDPTDEFYPFQILRWSATSIKVRAGAYIRDVHGGQHVIEMAIPGTTSMDPNDLSSEITLTEASYVYLVLNNAYNPTTLTLTVNASYPTGDNTALYWVLGYCPNDGSAWTGGIQHYWKGGHIRYQYLELDGLSLDYDGSDEKTQIGGWDVASGEVPAQNDLFLFKDVTDNGTGYADITDISSALNAYWSSSPPSSIDEWSDLLDTATETGAPNTAIDVGDDGKIPIVTDIGGGDYRLLLTAPSSTQFWVKGEGAADCYGEAIGNDAQQVTIDLDNQALEDNGSECLNWDTTSVDVVAATVLKVLNTTKYTANDTGAVQIKGGINFQKQSGGTDGTRILDLLADGSGLSTFTAAIGAKSTNVQGIICFANGWGVYGKGNTYEGYLGDIFNVGAGGYFLDGAGARAVEICNGTYAIDVTAGDLNNAGVYKKGGTQVVGAQGAAVADATGAGDVVAQLNALLARVRAHGLIAT